MSPWAYNHEWLKVLSNRYISQTMRCKDNTFSLENHRNSKQMLKNLKFQKKKNDFYDKRFKD